MQPDPRLSENLRRMFQAVSDAGRRAAEAFNQWVREVALRPHRPTNVGTGKAPQPWCLTCNVAWPCDEVARLSGEDQHHAA